MGLAAQICPNKRANFRCRLLADSVEKLKNEMTTKSRGMTVESDFRQCNALWSACGGRPLEIALAMKVPHLNLR